MNSKPSIRKGRHCVFNLHVHLVFVTKYRKKVFTKKMLASLKEYFGKVCSDYASVLVETNGEADHIHLLITYPPKVSISKLVNSLKTVSTRRLRSLYPNMKKSLYKNQLWSPSYFAGSCGGAPIDIVRAYVENQGCIKSYIPS